MDRRKLSVALALAASLLAALPASVHAASHSEAMGPPSMFVIHREHVKPGMVAGYEQAGKDFVALVQKDRSLSPLFSFQALQGEDFAYSYVTPIRSLADGDAIYAGFAKLAEAHGERWADVMKRSFGAMNSYDEAVFAMMPEVSYHPANEHVAPGMAKYYQLDFYRVVPGMEEEAAAVAAAWKQMFAAKNLPYGYSVYRMVLGEGMPLIVVSTPAKDPADLAAINAASRKAIGEAAFDAQMAKTMAITRAFSSEHYWARPDLSLAPMAAGK